MLLLLLVLLQRVTDGSIQGGYIEAQASKNTTIQIRLISTASHYSHDEWLTRELKTLTAGKYLIDGNKRRMLWCPPAVRSGRNSLCFVLRGKKKKEFNMRPRSGQEMRVMAIKKVTSAHWTVHDSFHSTASVDIQSHSSGPSQIPSSGALGRWLLRSWRIFCSASIFP